MPNSIFEFQEKSTGNVIRATRIFYRKPPNPIYQWAILCGDNRGIMCDAEFKQKYVPSNQAAQYYVDNPDCEHSTDCSVGFGDKC